MNKPSISKPLYATRDEAITSIETRLKELAGDILVSEKFREIEHSNKWAPEDREFHRLFNWLGVLKKESHDSVIANFNDRMANKHRETGNE